MQGEDGIADFLSGPAAVGLAAIWGAVWGSFFNVVIARLPRGESIVRPASRCPQCRTPIAARDNVPVLSYLLLRGRCRSCGAPISWRYPGVELLTAALGALLFWKFAGAGADIVGEPVVRVGRFLVYFTFAGALVVLAFIDLDTQRLPDAITLPGIVVLFLAAFAAHDVSWKERAIGAAAGYLFVRLVADFYFYVLKREGLGLGDGKLLAMVGAVLGWKALPVVLFLASLVGTLVALPVLLVRRHQPGRARAPSQGESRGEPPAESQSESQDDSSHGLPLRHVQIPFGPFLAASSLIYLFAGPWIWALVFPGE